MHFTQDILKQSLDEPLKIVKRPVTEFNETILRVDHDQYSVRENDLLLKKPTLYRAFSQVNR